MERSRTRRALVATMAALALLSMSPAHAGSQAVHRAAAHHPARAGGRHEPNYAWRVFRATNRSRVAQHVPRLSLDREVSILAVHHALAMARARELFHTSDLSRYLSAAGSWSRWGENVGWTSDDITSLQGAFMASPGHRSNLLSRTFRHVGVGAVRVNGVLWVSLFFYG